LDTPFVRETEAKGMIEHKKRNKGNRMPVLYFNWRGKGKKERAGERLLYLRGEERGEPETILRKRWRGRRRGEKKRLNSSTSWGKKGEKGKRKEALNHPIFMREKQLGGTCLVLRKEGKNKGRGWAVTLVIYKEGERGGVRPLYQLLLWTRKKNVSRASGSREGEKERKEKKKKRSRMKIYI